MRRFVFFPALAVAVALLAVAAGASWLAGGTGSSSTGSVALGTPTAVSASATGTTSIRVTWGVPAAPSPAPTTYDVFRYIGGTGTKVCSAVSATSTRVCDDSGLSPGTTYGYTVEARLGANWMSGQTELVSATTEAPPVSTGAFVVQPVVAGNKTAGTAFQVRITARTGTATDAGYAGAKNLTFSGPGQNTGFAAPSYPANPVTFSAGVATVEVTLRKAEAASLTVTDGTRSGTTPVTVVAGDPATLTYTSSRAVPKEGSPRSVTCNGGIVVVGNGGTFATRVTRAPLDASGNPATGNQVTVSFSKTPNSGTGPGTATIASTQTTSNEVSLTLPNGGEPTPVLLTASIGSASVSCTVQRNNP